MPQPESSPATRAERVVGDDARLIGKPIRRVEDERLLTGRGRYVADVVLPGLLHVAFARSPHAHARIARVDASGACPLPGVVACITGGDLERDARPIVAASRMKGYHATPMPALAGSKARYQGEAIVAVVAETRYAAEDAVDAIAIDYEPLPAIADPRAGGREGSALIHEDAGTNVILTRTFAQGDVDAAIAGAAVRVKDTFTFHRHAAVALENRACLADWNAGTESLTLWSSTQVPGMLR